nr:DUF4352 domain-containing protein [uncultured Actinoplanes sp.]
MAGSTSHDSPPQLRRRPDRGDRRRAPLKPLVALGIAAVAVVALFAAGAAAQRYGSAATAVPSAPAATAPARAVPTRPSPAIGDPVRDGKFEFVVTGVDCSRTSIGLEHLRRTAKGRYCVVSLSVRNIADGPKYFLGKAQKAFDATGASYRGDQLAGLYANQNLTTFVQRLTPGRQVAGKLVFDVPATAELTGVELHDSLLSGGVRVALTS